MSRETEVTIQGNRFVIRAFDPFRQLRLFGDLQREVLPSVGGVINVAFGKDEAGDKDASDRAGVEAFSRLSQSFDGATLMKWCDLLLDADHITVEVDGGGPEKLDKKARAEAFADFSGVLELLYHVGRLNFAAPLARWAGLTGLAQKLTGRLSGLSEKTSKAS